ncbi:hypothetical protein M8C21_004100 [Ambrosia artemisiifolia]|uniref:Uncharacterized protein n=1 Tax=Ambrosia artemisiifolia TaxID=4212 RepID=A0AAD5CBZ1_AMBAR|nr:hypothetical protein M8C21_004100 [Ambrosia artemisiifolia]
MQEELITLIQEMLKQNRFHIILVITVRAFGAGGEAGPKIASLQLAAVISDVVWLIMMAI